MELGIRFVERDLQVAVAADEGNAGLAVVIEEDELVALARNDAASLDLAVVEEAAAQVRRVLPVVEAAHHIGPPNIAELEGDQDFIVDLRNEDRAAVRPGAELGDAGPVRLVVVVQPGELELDPGVVVRVVVVRDERYHHTRDGRAAGGRMPVRRPERGQAEQSTVLPAADYEMRAIALFAEHMTRARQGGLAGALVAADADAD